MGYYAGVTQALLEAKPPVLVPGQTISGGLSGGAWSLIAAHLGYNGKQLLQMWTDLFTSDKAKQLLTATKGPGIIGHINTLAVWELAGRLPANPQHTLNNCMRVAISQLDANKTNINNSASWIVNYWENRADAEATLLATNYISCYSGPTVYTYFRNQPVIDGGYSSGFKQLCPGGRLSNCIKAASHYVGSQAANTTCDPERCGNSSNACTSNGRTNIITTLYQNGPYVDRWKLFEVVQRCPPELWQGRDPYPSPNFVPQATPDMLPDIYPGRYNDLPMWNGTRLLACEWQRYAMAPPVNNITGWLNVTYEQGYADAQAWVRHRWG